MQRRDIIRGAVAGGLVVIVGEQEAQATPGQDPVTIAVGLAFKWAWDNVVPKEAKDELYATATDVAKALHRAVVSVIGRGAINGRIATITIRIGKRADGQATMSGQLENMSGSGTPHAVWSGTAPHHRHATMHGHIRRIINDSHGWLVRNRM